LVNPSPFSAIPPAPPPPALPTRRRDGYRRFVALLVVLLVVDLAWKAGLIPPQRVSAAPARGGLAGPSVASEPQIKAALDRYVSYGYPVSCGAGRRPLVALTFDDGPGPDTRRVVNILKRAGARATFFIVAKEIDAWPNLAGEPRREAKIAAIGDHTYDHIDLVGVAQDELDHQIVDSRRVIQEHAGVPVRLFRPPYGSHDAAVDHEVRAQGMLQVLWSVDSGDGAPGSTGPVVLQNVTDGLRAGAIILMHENRGTTLHELPRILQAVRARGLHTVTVPELLAADPPSRSQVRTGTCH
jgi:peptidoglycan/xylan/chitin deacetylase (PgdA/CDA1 family)